MKLGLACLSLTVLLGGCGTYLHDDNLQTETDAALTTYTAANIPGVLKQAIANQTQVDQQVLSGAVIQENADRDAAVADLVSGHDTTIGASKKIVNDCASSISTMLCERIELRLEQLGGTGYNFDADDWDNRHERLVTLQLNRQFLCTKLDEEGAKYSVDGGTGFKDCETKLVRPANLSEAAGTDADLINTNYGTLKDLEAQIATANAAPTEIEKQTDSLIAAANSYLTLSSSDVAKDQDALETAQAQENKAKAAAATITSTSTSATVTKVLSQVQQNLKNADSVAGLVGANEFEPSAVLERIKFWNTNLCDVVAASSQSSCTGTSVSTAATDANKAVLGAIEGLAEITGVDTPKANGVAAIALADQTALETAAQAKLDALTQTQALYQDDVNSLLEEAELLLNARTALQSASKAAPCKDSSALASMQTNAPCVDPDGYLARALTAYNLSWARGQTAARLDEIKISQIGPMLKLKIAQANATADDSILTGALTELDAYGKGGVTAQTIASFIQAFATIAIAKGVN